MPVPEPSIRLNAPDISLSTGLGGLTAELTGRARG
jgi:hypothetical protein